MPGHDATDGGSRTASTYVIIQKTKDFLDWLSKLKLSVTFCFALLTFTTCKNTNVTRDLYDDSNYQKVILPDSSLEGVDLFVLKTDTNYKLLKTYYNNGNIQVKSYIHNNLSDGKSLEYYEDGNLLSEVTYTNGKKNGIVKKYWPNRKLALVEYYKQGNPVGEWQYYDSTGKVEKVIRH